MESTPQRPSWNAQSFYAVIGCEFTCTGNSLYLFSGLFSSKVAASSSLSPALLISCTFHFPSNLLQVNYCMMSQLQVLYKTSCYIIPFSAGQTRGREFFLKPDAFRTNRVSTTEEIVNKLIVKKCLSDHMLVAFRLVFIFSNISAFELWGDNSWL